MKCDYDVSSGFSPSEGLGCLKGKATRRVTVEYNEVEADTLNLCEECYKRLKVLVRRHGYRLRSTEIKT